MTLPLWKQLTSEAIGTFCLVFAGTGAVVVNDQAGNSVTHLGIALTFGLIVLAMIYCLGDISGAHINPAVTIGFFAAKRFPGKRVAPFILSQCAGGVLASGLLVWLFPGHQHYGATLPAGADWQSFVLEIVLTFILMFVILGVSTGAKEKGITAGIAVGSTVALEALFAGPISGASMNPARSLGPAIASLDFSALWIYLSAPFLGAIAAIPACRCTRESGCC